MNKKDTLKLKPGTWIEVEQGNEVVVALVVGRSVDIGAGCVASAQVFMNGRLSRAPQSTIIQVLETLKLPESPTAYHRSLEHSRRIREVKESVAAARKRKDERYTDAVEFQTDPKKQSKKRTDPKLICDKDKPACERETRGYVPYHERVGRAQPKDRIGEALGSIDPNDIIFR
jgi:hypothetical protein